MLRIKHINALNRFALRYGYGWRRRLLEALTKGTPLPGRTSERDVVLLRELHALTGEGIIETFVPVREGYTKLVYLRKDHIERYNDDRNWFVNAWRLVDQRGSDVLIPWVRTKTEAREKAKDANVYVIED
ncbi:hypothetical protein AB4Y45_34095 [Paraburkholderia sp. EG287A]|uniref:hypothetical protein n=1 Tax=Paraburkholderia sp. EG287A TaxID=3237012 RepID=UPI0034D2E205